jgi:hypothetical protein
MISEAFGLISQGRIALLFARHLKIFWLSDASNFMLKLAVADVVPLW